MTQTETMRRIAGKDKIYGAEQDEKGWWGFEMVNHPMPSGTRRLMLTYTDNRRWPTKEKAIEVITKAMKELDEAYAREDAEREAAEAEELTRG